METANGNVPEPNGADADALPEGISSLLDTDLYKLTMQCAVLKYFPDVDVTYAFTNRTPYMKLTRAAFRWLETQVAKLANISVTPEELQYLEKACPYLNQPYLRYLRTFQLRPSKQIYLSFKTSDGSDDKDDTDGDDELGDLHIDVKGRWVETILYEIPLLALTSEAYFRFCDRDWTYESQEEKARSKGATLLQHGCHFSEFGSRRRRDYHTQELVIRGLMQAADDGAKEGWDGKLVGTSNVHFAMKYGLSPVGTVAHEWFMGVAAVTDNYEDANEIALRYWIGCFGTGVLGIALTDTFGTSAFLDAFQKQIPEHTSAQSGMATTLPSTGTLENLSVTTARLSKTKPPFHAPVESDGSSKNDGGGPLQPSQDGLSQDGDSHKGKTYAEVFAGVRQDSGDPAGFIAKMNDFYASQGIPTDKKIIVFSDSLNIDLCLEYKRESEKYGFIPTFGIGTFFTNDFVRASSLPAQTSDDAAHGQTDSGKDEKPTGVKSVPLNIVIKLSSAGGRPAVKISDNIGKNTGDEDTVRQVKRRLGYVEHEWLAEVDGEKIDGGSKRRRMGDEAARWG